MARIRSVHPGLWTDEAFVSLSPLARLLAIGIWNECDDMGAFEWKPVTLKMRILPVDNADVPDLLAELTGANVVGQYDADGRKYGAVRNFGRFQRPKKPKSTHPMPAEWRKYAATDSTSSPLDDDDTGSGSEPQVDKAPAVPKKAELTVVKASEVPQDSEIPPQMEDGGDNRRKKEPPSLRDVPPDAGKRGSRLSDDWCPSETECDFAAGLGLDPDRIAQRFRDFWHSKPGAGGRKLDWTATWRNWCRKDAETRRPEAEDPIAKLHRVMGLDPKQAPLFQQNQGIVH